jgi:hypothetical protein
MFWAWLAVFFFSPVVQAKPLWQRYTEVYDRTVDRVEALDPYGVTAQLPKGIFSAKMDWNTRRAVGRYTDTGTRTDLVQPILFGEEKDPLLLMDLGASGSGGGLTTQFSYGITGHLDFYLEVPFQRMDVQVRPKLRRLNLLAMAMINGLLPAGYPKIDSGWFDNGVTKPEHLDRASAWLLGYMPRLGRPSLMDSSDYPADVGPGTGYNSEGWVIADINCGLSWNFFRSPRFSGGLTGRVYFPTGNVSNPDRAFTLGTGAELDRGTGSFGVGFTNGYDVRLYKYRRWVDLILSGEFTAVYYFQSTRRYPEFPKPTADGEQLLDLLDPERIFFPDMSDLAGRSYEYTPGFGSQIALTLGVTVLLLDLGVTFAYSYAQEPELDADPRFKSMVRNLQLQLAMQDERLRLSVGLNLVPLYIPLQIHYQYEHSLGGRNSLVFDRNHWITLKGYLPTVL